MEIPYLRQLNWIDILILVFLIRGIYLGFTRGSGWGIVRFVGIITVSLIAFSKSYPLALWAQERFHIRSPFLEWACFILLGVVLGFVVNILIGGLTRMLKFGPEGWVGRVVGTVLGVVQASFLVSLVLVTLVMSAQQYLNDSVKKRSVLGPRFMKITPVLYTGLRGFVVGGGEPSHKSWEMVTEL
ncbi:MAG: CvpA family protein [Candidatus Omnitrophica bacterium]|nr:CvpA family protein [Candidatus Omnitrophota bacterium]